MGSVAVAHGLSCPPQQVGSSWTRDRTHVLCIGRWILYHWTFREVQLLFLLLFVVENTIRKKKIKITNNPTIQKKMIYYPFRHVVYVFVCIYSLKTSFYTWWTFFCFLKHSYFSLSSVVFTLTLWSSFLLALFSVVCIMKTIGFSIVS